MAGAPSSPGRAGQVGESPSTPCSSTSFSWTALPSSRKEASQAVVPFGVVVTPLRPLTARADPPVTPLPYGPLSCNRCGACIAPCCAVGLQHSVAKSWSCTFCNAHQLFPAHYSAIRHDNLPAECIYNEVEYELQGTPGVPPTFIFVVDLHTPEHERVSLKQALEQVISSIPDECHVGLISFGEHVYVHDLGTDSMPRMHCFDGASAVTPSQIRDMLSAARSFGNPCPDSQAGYLPSLGDASLALENALEALPFATGEPPRGERPPRATGPAVAAAVGLAEAAVTRGSARLSAFLAGPGTRGPGAIVGAGLDADVRSHDDIAAMNVPGLAAAVDTYDALGGRLAAAGHTLDVFACGPEQFGILEMELAISATGGIALLAESFSCPTFRVSIMRHFERDKSGALVMGMGARLRVLTSEGLQVEGALGGCASPGGTAASIRLKPGEQLIKADGALGDEWVLNGMHPQASIGLIFKITQNDLPPATSATVQFRLTYRHGSGTTRMRVITTQLPWLFPERAGVCGANTGLATHFDARTTATVMARLAAHRTLSEELNEVVRWVDLKLIQLCRRFGTYETDKPESVLMPRGFKDYPALIFGLRASPFLRTFGTSPDETAYARIHLHRAPPASAERMIQPWLYAYSLKCPKHPRRVALDIKEMHPRRLLLLDTWFTLVLHTGSHLAAWRKEGLHRKQEHSALAELFHTAHSDLERLARSRHPRPRIVVCDEGTSQARFLLAILNPSVTYKTDNGMDADAFLLTDDISLQVFMEHLAIHVCS